jgi:RNA polymerase sigma factor (sigma-70 family)
LSSSEYRSALRAAAANRVRSTHGSDHASRLLDMAYREERSWLLRYFGRHADRDIAPDLVQEVFARAAGSTTLADAANPIGFLRRIARNLLIDRGRRQKHRAPDQPLDETIVVPVPPEQEWRIVEADLLRVFEAALDTLPEKTRRIFLMHRVEELSYRQIHMRLGISVATVKYHMMMALTHIAREVEEAE